MPNNSQSFHELDTATKVIIIQQMIAEQKRLAYGYELQGRAAKTIGGEEDSLYKQSVAALTRVQALIDIYQTELEKLQKKPNQ